MNHIIVKAGFIIAILFLNVNFSYLSAKEKIAAKTNYEIFDSLANVLSENVYNQTVSGKYKKINLFISSSPASGLIEKAFTRRCIDSLTAFQSDSLLPVTHKININRFEMNYSLYPESADSLIRTFYLDTYISGANPVYQNFSEFNFLFCDTVSRDDLSLIQSISNQSVNAPIPEKQMTFYQKMLEPVILVSAAILTVVILFSVRSK